MKSYLSRKESIIISAIEIIDKKGVFDLTLRDIADSEGISEAALYKHFDSREEIIMEILDYFCRYDLSIIETIKNSTMTSKEAVVFFIRTLAESVESHPAMACIVSYYEVLTKDQPSVNKTRDIFIKRMEFIEYLVSKGQHEGNINSNFSSIDLSVILTGILRTYILLWRMQNYSFQMKDAVLSAVESIINVC